MSESGNPRAILISGPWSSGTTAIAGALKCMGLEGFGPYFLTSDARTPISYEMIPFRDLVMSLASEPELKITEPSRERISTEISRFRQRILDQEFGCYDPSTGPALFLKYPLSALLIAELGAFFDLRLIVVTRPFHDIEESRRRRRWAAYYGALGAKVIYAHIFNALINGGVPAHFVHYPKLLREPESCMRLIAEFCGIESDAERIRSAVGFVEESAAARLIRSEVGPPEN